MRYVLVHSHEQTLDLAEGAAAHCFGPFESWEAVVAFQQVADPDDDCYKFALPLVGPEQQDVDNLILTELEEATEDLFAAARPDRLLPN